MTSFMCCCWSRTTRKGRVYKNATRMLFSYVRKRYKMLRECYKMLRERYANATNTQHSKSSETYKNATDAMRSLVIKRSLSLFSSKHLRIEVLRVLQMLEYKLLRKDYLQINAFFVLVMVVWKKWPRALQRKVTGGATVVVREWPAGRSTVWLSER